MVTSVFIPCLGAKRRFRNRPLLRSGAAGLADRREKIAYPVASADFASSAAEHRVVQQMVRASSTSGVIVKQEEQGPGMKLTVTTQDKQAQEDRRYWHRHTPEEHLMKWND